MQEISAHNLGNVNGAGLFEAIGYGLGYLASKIGEVDMQGALQQGG